jgi:uric acid transporter
MGGEVHPVDQVLPIPRLLALGLRVLVMYAGAVAAPDHRPR